MALHNPLALIHRSNLGHQEKGDLRKFVEMALGATSEAEKRVLQSRAQNHLTEAGANVRGVITGGIAGAGLGMLDSAHGLDRHGMALDIAVAGVASVIAVAMAHDMPEAAKTCRELATGASAVAGFRASKDWHAKAAGTPPPASGAKVHGDDTDLIAFAHGMRRQ